MADENLDASYGIKTAGAAPKAPPPGILDPASVGAKTLQSATFGFGADAAGAVFGKQAESAIRDLEKGYDKAHPLASVAIDLAVGLAEGAATGGTSAVVAGGIKGIAKGAAIGAGMSALSGAGSGGTLQEREKKAASGAVTGALGGAAFGGLGTILKPLADRFGKMGFNGEKEAANLITASLKKEGKTPQELDSFMRQNPNARIADFSPEVASLVAKVGGQTQKTADDLGTKLREDVSGQAARLQTQSTPLQHVKQQMTDNLSKIQVDQKKAYATAYSEITPLTPELKAALAHKDVEPLVKQSLEDFGTMRTRSGSPQSQAAKYKVGSELPTAVIDDLQKKVGALAKDPSAIGTMRAGALQTAQSALKDAQPATLDRAQRLAATVGGSDSKTGIIGAQTWGSQFAFGLKTADIDHWRGMNPLEKQYARLGMTDGLEKYLAGKSMGEKPLRDIAQTLKSHPEIREVLGEKDANSISKTFSKEADRARASQKMSSGGSKRAMFNEEDVARNLGHGANVALGGAGGHVLGTGARILMKVGMPEKTAMRVIDTATKPGGLAQLKKDGMSQNMLDKVAAIVSQNRVGGAATGGRVLSQENSKSER